jgi:membrane-associated protein
MTSTLALLDFLNPENILNWLGPMALIGVILIIFAECGLLIGFFMPGDSLLFITGLFIAQGYIDTPIWLAALLLAAAAVLGNAAGYWIGYVVGPKLFNKPDSKLFRKEYVDKTHEFFERYGARAIVLARFVPIVRTFITAMAGVGRMDFRVYMTYSTIGGLLWGAGVTYLGYGLGNVPFVKDNIELILIAVVLVSAIPILIEYVRHKRQTVPSTD